MGTMGRSGFGIMKRNNDGLQAMVEAWSRPTKIDLSGFQSGRPEDNTAELNNAITGAIGSVLGAVKWRPASAGRHSSGGHSSGGVSVGGMDHGSVGPARMFANGGRLQEGVSIVGDAGPEFAVKHGNNVDIVPMQAHPQETPAASDPVKDAIIRRIAGYQNNRSTPTPSQIDPATATWQEIQRREGKDWNGADRAPTHNWKDVLKSVALGSLSAMRGVGPNDGVAGSLGKLLGGAIGGGVATAFDRNADEKLGNEMALDKLYGDYQRQYGMQRQRDVDAANIGKINADAAWNLARPDVEQAKIDARAQIEQARIDAGLQKARQAAEMVLKRADLRSGEGKLDTDAEGRMIIVFPKADSQGRMRPPEPVLINNQPVFVPGEQGVSFKDPYSGQTITLKGKQAATAGINQTRNENANDVANRRLGLAEQQFGLAQQQFNFAKEQKMAAERKGDQKAAREWEDKLQEMYRRAFESHTKGDLTDEQFQTLVNGINNYR